VELGEIKFGDDGEVAVRGKKEWDVKER